ncbi:nucleoside 2-deoxyribosyltransferase [Providencia alcalifaciens]|nr:nucleoside 2-deoxyribosyltransferase [Providencia alcalifaciens]
MKIYFIACPYSDPDSNVVEMRFQECTKIAAELAVQGIATYSQITITHPINLYLAEQGKKVSWSAIDMEFLARCDGLIVLTLPGWDKSSGVAAEINYFKEKGMPVWTYDEFVQQL